MPEWYKTSQIASGDKLVFQPITEDGEERFSVWDVKNSSFIRSGEQIKTAKGVQDVNKYIKLSDEEKKVYRRNLKMYRQIMVDGKLYNMDFPITVDTALVQQMKTITEDIEKDPLTFEYILKREGSGLKTTYFVMSGKEVGLPVIPSEEEEAEESASDSSFSNLNISLTPRQQKVVNKIKEDGLTDQSDIYRVLIKYGFGKELADEVLKEIQK